MNRSNARLLITLALCCGAVAAIGVASARAGGSTLVPASGQVSPQTGAFTQAPDWSSFSEFMGVTEEADADGGAAAFDGIIDRSLSKGTGPGTAAAAGKKAKANPELGVTFEGLNLFQQRFARGGNQFTVEPPDQALCVGNGYVMEGVNDVINIYDEAGHSLLAPNEVGGAVDLNSFYGYPPAIDRTTGVRAQNLTDPTCLYDAQTGRFFLVVLTLETFPSGAFTLVNHLDVAVSDTSNPTGSWTVHKIDVTNDGSNPSASNACPCLGDYPHIGADANGFYITTNSYPWNGDGFDGAQIYAMSKRALAMGGTVRVTHIDTFDAVPVPSAETAAQPGFTAWPAQSPGSSSYDLDAGGTEYLLSSNAADEATHPVSGTGGSYVSNQLVVWALTNTASLDAGTAALGLSTKVLPVNRYAIPPRATQPGSGTNATGVVPQGTCVNDTNTLLANGRRGCWRLLRATEPPHNAVVSLLDANDTRMQQVDYANGKLWGALDTAVSFDTDPSHNRAGIAWYVIGPDVSSGTLAAKVKLQGTYGLADANLTYPAIGVTASGRGVVGMTLSGPNNLPSAAYAPIDAQVGIGDVHVAAAGQGHDDGFTGYPALGRARYRWGDYGAAAVDGDAIWIASEYIASPDCAYTTWGGSSFAGGSGPLGRCGNTRAAQANWSTAVSKLTP
jgi:hypothetical protein